MFEIPFLPQLLLISIDIIMIIKLTCKLRMMHLHLCNFDTKLSYSIIAFASHTILLDKIKLVTQNAMQK